MWTQTVFKLLALSLAGGIFCGAFWDVFKIPKAFLGRCKSKAKNIIRIVVTFVTDVVFCLLCGCVAILVFYYGNEGNIRGIAVALMAAGFWAYRVSFGAFISFLARKISRIVKKVGLKLTCKFKELIFKLKKDKIKEE